MFEYYSERTIEAEKSLEEHDSIMREAEYKYEDQLSQIESVNEDISKIDSSIKDIKLKLKEYENELSELLLEKRKLENDLPNLEQEYSVAEEEYNSKEWELEEFKKEDIGNLISRLSKSNSQEVTISPATKTTKIMDNFSNSDKIFLVFRSAYYIDDRKKISLIGIRKFNNPPHCHNECPTMTELKQSFGSSIKHVLNKCPDRLYCMLKEISEYLKNYKVASGDKIAFETPHTFGGRTSSNLVNLGCEWTGGGDYEVNTLYGEVTEFLMIGFIIE